MRQSTAEAYLNAGPCSGVGATCFQVLGGRAFYRIGNTYYCNSLSSYVAATSMWGLNAACTQGGAEDFKVANGVPYWRISSTYYRNSGSVAEFVGEGRGRSAGAHARPPASPTPLSAGVQRRLARFATDALVLDNGSDKRPPGDFGGAACPQGWDDGRVGGDGGWGIRA